MNIKVLYTKNFIYYAVITLSVVIANLIIMGFTGNQLTGGNVYNSYAIQAQSWLNGRFDIAENYSHLEIAVYNGRYFISFPPFPSIFLLPFVMIFGTNTPDHIITLLMAAAAGIFAFKLAFIITESSEKSLFYSLFLTIGTNFLFLSNTGFVWFMAQVFAFSFTVMAFYYAVKAKPNQYLALFFFCCALGCRPLNAVFLPLLFYLQYRTQQNFFSFIKKLMLWAIPAILLGCVYMFLNYMRFDNIFEFGHNYLPEFTDAEYGQFHINYFSENFKTLWRLPRMVNGRLQFHTFNGTAFWLVSPIVITYVFTLIRKIITDRKIIIPAFILASCLLLLLLSCTHKTMGGWHFGHRYTVDMLPVLFLGLLLQDKNFGKQAVLLSIPLFVWGFAVNTVGTIFLYWGIL